MNLQDLDQAISILYMPQGGKQGELMQQAQQFCQAFISQYSSNLAQLLSLYEDPQVQGLKDITKFWLLQSIVDIAANHERYNQATSTMEIKQTLYLKFFSVLRENYSIVLGAKHTSSKFAQLFVLIAKWDFPQIWPEAFSTLISIMTWSQDLSIQKLYLKFIVQVLLTMDEDLIERYEVNDQLHNERANNIKDGIRAGPIVKICQLLQQALTNFEIFDSETINGCLKISAQLIDWNILDHFAPIIQIVKQILAACQTEPKLKQFRTNAMRVIQAVVDKGMDYPLKIDVIVSIQYLDIVESFQMKYRERKGDDEEQEEEEEFFSAVSFSVSKLGQWCLELFQHHEKILTSAEHQQQYESILGRLLNFSITLLDCQKPKVGRPILDLFSFWLQAIKKLENLNDYYGQMMIQLIKLSVTRLSFPKWFKFSDSDGQSDFEEDFLKYRDELGANVFSNIAQIKPFRDTLLQILAELLSTINPESSTFSQAEVTLYLIYNLQQSIPSELREITTDNKYCELLQYMLRIDFMAFNHQSVNLMLLENIVRYIPYFIKMPGFGLQVASIFFSDKALLSRNQSLAKRSSYLLLRLCEKIVNSEDQSSFALIMENTLKVLETIISGKQRETVLNYEDAINLYQVLGVFVSSQNFDQAIRLTCIQQVYQVLYGKLVEYSQQNDIEKVHWILKFINTFSKNFEVKQQIFSGMKEYFSQVLQQSLNIMSAHLKQPLICDQVLQYMQKCVNLLGTDCIGFLNQVGQTYLANVEFERLDIFINLLSFAVMNLKSDAAPLVLSLLPIAYQRMLSLPIPQTDTSDVDKLTLRVFASFIRFIQMCVDNAQISNTLPQDLSYWLILNFNQSPDKTVKKTIAAIIKELIFQITGLKASTQYKESIAQILNINKKSLPNNTTSPSQVIDLQSISPAQQTIIEQGLILSAQGIFKQNPSLLDDQQIIKGLSEIQLIFVMLGFSSQLKQQLNANAIQIGVQNTQLLVEQCEQFLLNPKQQIRVFQNEYVKVLSQIGIGKH